MPNPTTVAPQQRRVDVSAMNILALASRYEDNILSLASRYQDNDINCLLLTLRPLRPAGQ